MTDNDDFLPPYALPFCVDRTAHLGRRNWVLPVRQQDRHKLFIDLNPFRLALDAYISEPSEERMTMARHHATLVHQATADTTLPSMWREMHDFATILMEATDWHPDKLAS
jgi:hypothetical protein